MVLNHGHIYSEFDFAASGSQMILDTAQENTNLLLFSWVGESPLVTSPSNYLHRIHHCLNLHQDRPNSSVEALGSMPIFVNVPEFSIGTLGLRFGATIYG